MKDSILLKLALVVLLFCIVESSKAQVYNNVARVLFGGYPNHGHKIKTNLPMEHQLDMVSLSVTGYAYGNVQSINLTLSFYLFLGNSGMVEFFNPTISSSGGYVPKVKLANENGKVVVFIEDQSYFPRFYVDAFSGFNISQTYYENWSIVDEPLMGSAVVELIYKNSFSGNVHLPANSIWDAAGNVGIGTSTPNERLAVNGNIRAKEIKVEAGPWPDYVFEEDYKLGSLTELEQFVKANKHLPGVPKAADVEEHGLSLGEMNRILMQKVEELTLHLITLDKSYGTLQANNDRLNKELAELKEMVKSKEQN